MAVQAIARQSEGPRLLDSLFSDAFALMRERLPVYALFAAICGAAGFLGVPKPLEFTNGVAFRLVMVFALFAILCIIPTAMRRLDPSFRMTLWRGAVAISMLVVIGVCTELGYVALIIPGIVLAVLMSQALVAALLLPPAERSVGGFFMQIRRAVVTSFTLTKSHFMTTLGVVFASLLVLLVPFFFMLVALVILEVLAPRSLVVTAPMLLLTIVYFECVRYSLLVRWYARLTGSPISR